MSIPARDAVSVSKACQAGALTGGRACSKKTDFTVQARKLSTCCKEAIHAARSHFAKVLLGLLDLLFIGV